MPKTKLLEGYLRYIENSDDPNLKQCKEEHGQDYLTHSIEAWKSETRPEDHGAIPEKELVRLCSKRKNR